MSIPEGVGEIDADFVLRRRVHAGLVHEENEKPNKDNAARARKYPAAFGMAGRKAAAPSSASEHIASSHSRRCEPGRLPAKCGEFLAPVPCLP